MLNLSNHLAITKSSSVEHIQDEQHTADLSKVITMDSKVRFEVANSNIWLNHLATTTIIQVGYLGGALGYSIKWSGGSMTLNHPEKGEVIVKIINGCPQVEKT